MPGLPDPFAEGAFYENVSAKRLVAFVFDGVITLAMTIVTLPLTAFLGLFFFSFLWTVISFFYRLFTLRNASATWGMRLMAIELREADGLRLRPGTALMHVCGLYLSFGLAPLQMVSVVLMVALGRGQGLTDLVLGTAMVNRPA